MHAEGQKEYPRRFFFCSSAYPLNDQCHILESQLMVQLRQLVPVWEQGPAVLGAAHTQSHVAYVAPRRFKDMHAS